MRVSYVIAAFDWKFSIAIDREFCQSYIKKKKHVAVHGKWSIELFHLNVYWIRRSELLTAVLLRIQFVGCYTFWGEWLPTFRRIVISLYLASNSVSAEHEGFNIFRNVGNHTTVLLRIHVLGRVVTDVSEDRNTFIFSVEVYFSWWRRFYYLPKRREPRNSVAEDSSSRASGYRRFGIPLYLA